jgi:hypothetical protein
MLFIYATLSELINCESIKSEPKKVGGQALWRLEPDVKATGGGQTRARHIIAMLYTMDFSSLCWSIEKCRENGNDCSIGIQIEGNTLKVETANENGK